MKTIVNFMLSGLLAFGCIYSGKAQGVLKEVNTSSAKEIMNRMPANAAYVYPEFRQGVAYFAKR